MGYCCVHAAFQRSSGLPGLQPRPHPQCSSSAIGRRPPSRHHLLSKELCVIVTRGHLQTSNGPGCLAELESPLRQGLESLNHPPSSHRAPPIGSHLIRHREWSPHVGCLFRGVSVAPFRFGGGATRRGRPSVLSTNGFGFGLWLGPMGRSFRTSSVCLAVGLAAPCGKVL